MKRNCMYRYLFLLITSLSIVLLTGKNAFADVLSPGTIYSCGEIASAGVYTLSSTSTFSVAPGNDCIRVTSGGTVDDTVIDGNGATITGNVNGDGVNPGDSGFNFTLENATVIGTTSTSGIDLADCSTYGGLGGIVKILNSTTTALVANGGKIETVTACSPTPSQYYGGDGGFFTISTSTFTTISTVGADGGTGGYGGRIVIFNSDSSLASSTISLGGGHGTDLSVAGYLEVHYTVFDYVNYLFSALNWLYLYGPDNLPGEIFNNTPFAGGYLYTPPGDTTCSSSLITAGIYTLTGDVTGDCTIAGNGVILNGQGHTINGNVHGDGSGFDTSGYTFTLENVTVTGTTSATLGAGNITVNNSTTSVITVNNEGDRFAGNVGEIHLINSTSTSLYASASRYGATCGLCTVQSGHAGVIDVTNSVFTHIYADSIIGASSTGGTITITGTNVDVSSTTVSATGLVNGILTINYATLVNDNFTLSALSDLILNGPSNLPGDLGSFGGGVLSLDNTIYNASQCSNLGISQTYFLANNITGNCVIKANNVVIDGAGQWTVNGSITGDATVVGNNGYNFTLQNITVTGPVTSNGSIVYLSQVSQTAGAGGSITIDHATTSDITSLGAAPCAHFKIGNPCGTGGNVIVRDSYVGNINVDGGSSQSSQLSGQGGTIVISTSTTASLSANGGNGDTQGGNGGSVTVTNSLENIASSTISARGGNSLLCGSGGNGGSINLLNSTYTGSIINTAGNDASDCSYSYSGSSGHSGSIQVLGQYSQVVSTVAPTEPAPALIPTPVVVPKTPAVSGSSGSFITPPISDSVPVETIPTSPIPPRTFGSVAAQAIQQVTKVATAVANSPAAKTVQTVGFFGGLAASVAFYTDSAFATPVAASEVLLIPVRLWGLLLAGLGIRKRSRPWGTVYDSVTKQPIDPAFVTARDASGKVVAESFTDIDGRYGFLLPDGVYYISAQKTNYEFPSKKMVGKQNDELYSDLYFGESVIIHSGQVLDKNIPMDQKNFDWNEYAKKKRNALLFHSKYEKPWAVVSNYVYGIGLAISVIATVIHPTTYNIVILVSYAVVLISFNFTSRKKKLGSIIDKETHDPLSYAIFRVTGSDHQTVLRSGACDVLGRFYCIVPKGECYIDIEKKNVDGTYVKVYESALLNNKTGFINSDLVV
ncbi:MAG: carboxypeptidase-like regulatory domain-containing protein [Patescibacteria group bacterium]